MVNKFNNLKRAQRHLEALWYRIFRGAEWLIAPDMIELEDEFLDCLDDAPEFQLEYIDTGDMVDRLGHNIRKYNYEIGIREELLTMDKFHLLSERLIDRMNDEIRWYRQQIGNNRDALAAESVG